MEDREDYCTTCKDFTVRLKLCVNCHDREAHMAQATITRLTTKVSELESELTEYRNRVFAGDVWVVRYVVDGNEIERSGTEMEVRRVLKWVRKDGSATNIRFVHKRVYRMRCKSLHQTCNDPPKGDGNCMAYSAFLNDAIVVSKELVRGAPKAYPRWRPL
jgi:hypothetical protein